ncbi:MAG: hypothetical protein MUE36_08230 [Acidimicrobiales bacterium]|jgi:hypothetical protein|nr:hypothetical protein [Acidimicrobiales bacterium]
MDVWTGWMLLELAAFLLKVWALVSVLRFPAWAWSQAGRSRGLWLVLILLSFFLPFIGLVIALTFLLFPWPAVRRMRALGAPVGFPGQGRI